MPLRTVVLLVVFAVVALLSLGVAQVETRLTELEKSLSAQLGEMRERLER